MADVIKTAEPEVEEGHGWVNVLLGHQDGLVTQVDFPYLPHHDGVVQMKGAYSVLKAIKDGDDELEINPALSDHSKDQIKWMHALKDDHQGYFTHLKELAGDCIGGNIWDNHQADRDSPSRPPAWVACPEHPLFEDLLIEHWSTRGHTVKRGVDVATWAKGLIDGYATIGKDYTARALGGFMTGISGTSTGTTATSLTDTGAPFSASSGGPPAGGGNTGQIVIATATGVYGVILSSSTTVLTIDCWHTLTAPDTVGSTPGATVAYIVVPGQSPAAWVAISVATRAFNAADSFLTNDGSTISEIWFSGGGLNRKLCTYAHTAGTSTYTQAATWTGNGSDTYPQVVASWGDFQAKMIASPSTSNTGQMLFRSVLSATATIAASGDQLTVTDTNTMS